MPVAFELEIIGLRDAIGRYANRSAALVQARRTMAREVGAEGLQMLRANAPKRSGKFAAGLRYRTDDTKTGKTTITFYSTGEPKKLLRWIVDGTPKHPIPRGGSAEMMAKGYPLHFYWEKLGKEVWLWSVQHPGTKPNDFVGRTYDILRPIAREKMNSVANYAIRVR